jgi:hypothetical protein
MAIRSKSSAKAPKEPWHSVSIVPGKNACAAVLANPRRRVLSRDALRLPLVGCDQSDSCQCRFQHHADRRTGARRDEDAGSGARGKVPPSERRRPGERRARD